MLISNPQGTYKLSLPCTHITHYSSKQILSSQGYRYCIYVLVPSLLISLQDLNLEVLATEAYQCMLEGSSLTGQSNTREQVIPCPTSDPVHLHAGMPSLEYILSSHVLHHYLMCVLTKYATAV